MPSTKTTTTSSRLLLIIIITIIQEITLIIPPKMETLQLKATALWAPLLILNEVNLS